MNADNIWGRLLSRSTINYTTECWESTYWQDKDGYCSITIKQKPIKCHRISFQLANPTIDITNLLVCHTCDNPCCFNPDHLFPGTSLDNTRDMMSKDRQHRKLNKQKVALMRSMHASGSHNIKQCAEFFGVNPSVASRIINNIMWI